MPKINMKETDYYKSGRHTENYKTALVAANEAGRIAKLNRISEYNKNPSLCTFCQSALPYEIRGNKFCNKSCAAKFNNKLRPVGHESRVAQASKLSGIPISDDEREKRRQRGPSFKFSKIEFHNCGACGKVFYTRGWCKSRKSCGAYECKTHLSVGRRTYVNGRRKIFYHYNIHQNEIVMLESSWEYNLALWMDERKIVWIRPKYIKWVDDRVNKERLYYPDFYLPDFNLYLDPKNGTAMKKEAHKMGAVEKLIPIIYGELTMIKERLTELSNSVDLVVK
jgi:hypothetical protein